jgi:acyl carrier protein
MWARVRSPRFSAISQASKSGQRIVACYFCATLAGMGAGASDREQRRAAILGALLEILCQETGKAPETISEQAQLEELGLDSLEQINVIYLCEERFHVKVPSSALNRMRTVEDVVNGLLELRQGHSA